MSKNNKLNVFKLRWLILLIVIVSLIILVLEQFNKTVEGQAQPVETWWYLPIEDYRIVSTLKKVKQAEVDAIIEPYMGRSFWNIPLAEIQSKLVRLDWVTKARVARSWPNLLGVSLTEQIPIARWGDNGLVNQLGEVFYPRSLDDYQDLVKLSGDLSFSSKVAKRFAQLQPLFADRQLWIAALALADDQVWTLTLFEGPQIRFSESLWQEQIERFLLVYPKLTNPLRNSAVYYDLRYSNGIALKQNIE